MMESNSWNPIREEFFKRTIENDFRKIYKAQLEIATNRVYTKGKRKTTVQGYGMAMQNRSGHLRATLEAANIRISGVNPLIMETSYPVYIRFLDMKTKGNFQIYNRQIWGVLYNETLPELKFGLTETIRKEIRSQLEDLFPRTSYNHEKEVPGYRQH